MAKGEQAKGWCSQMKKEKLINKINLLLAIVTELYEFLRSRVNVGRT